MSIFSTGLHGLRWRRGGVTVVNSSNVAGRELIFGKLGGGSLAIFFFPDRTYSLRVMTASPEDTPNVLADAKRLRADRARQVADVLRRQVLAGAYQTLPNEDALGGEFGVSRNTVRGALAVLVAEGLVSRVQGVGTVVTGEQRYPHALSRLSGLAEELREHGSVVNEVRAAGLVTAPPLIAARLGQAEVVYVERLRRLNGTPLSLIERHAGQSLSGGTLTAEAVNADPHTAALLGVAPGAALLAAERLASLADGTPVDYEYIRIRGDRLVLSGPLMRDNSNK
jgi:GntR family transcriptional regulator